MDIEEEVALKGRVGQLEDRVGELARELHRAVELLDRYGLTLANHLKVLRLDQGALAVRLGNIEGASMRTG